jgi:hypothetical protein
MITIVTERYTEDFVAYDRAFERTDGTGGFGFTCDINGVVDEASMPAEARENYRKCLAGEFEVEDIGVRTYRWSYTHPATGRCACRRIVVLDGDASCDCGRIYNQSGQELAHPSQWGEETGESFGTWRDE